MSTPAHTKQPTRTPSMESPKEKEDSLAQGVSEEFLKGAAGKAGEIAMGGLDQEQLDNAKAQAQDQLDAAQEELDDAKAQAQQKIDDAQQQLDDAKEKAQQQLDDQLEDAKGLLGKYCSCFA